MRHAPERPFAPIAEIIERFGCVECSWPMRAGLGVPSVVPWRTGDLNIWPRGTDGRNQNSNLNAYIDVSVSFETFDNVLVNNNAELASR